MYTYHYTDPLLHTELTFTSSSPDAQWATLINGRPIPFNTYDYAERCYHMYKGYGATDIHIVPVIML